MVGVKVGVGVAVGVRVNVGVKVGVGEEPSETVKKMAVGGPHPPLASGDSTKSVCCPGVRPVVEAANTAVYLGTCVRKAIVFALEPLIQEGLSNE